MQFEWLRPPTTSLATLASLRALRSLPADAAFPEWLGQAPRNFWPWLLQQMDTGGNQTNNLGWSLWANAQKHQPKLFFHLTSTEVIEFPWTESADQIKGLVRFFQDQDLPRGGILLSGLPNIPERYWAFVAAALYGLSWQELDFTTSSGGIEHARISTGVDLFLSQEIVAGQSIWEVAEQPGFPTTLYVPDQQWLVKERNHTKVMAWNQIHGPAFDPISPVALPTDSSLYQGIPRTHIAWLLRWITEGLCQDIRPGERLAVLSEVPGSQLSGLKAWWWGADLHFGAWPDHLHELPIEHLEVEDQKTGAFPAMLRSLLVRGSRSIDLPQAPDILSLRVS